MMSPAVCADIVLSGTRMHLRQEDLNIRVIADKGNMCEVLDASPRFTSLVRALPQRLRAWAAATMCPLLLSWKRQTLLRRS
jgi:hypothetical protein